MSKRKPAEDAAPTDAPDVELKPPDDGEAATDAERVPRKKRGPYKKREKKSDADNASHQLSPMLVKKAAIGPMLLSAAIASKFFDSMLIYDPAQLQECERMAGIWIEEMGLILHPGVQYAILATVAVGAGIMNSVPITKEVKEAMAKEQAAQKAMAAEQALANIEKAKQQREAAQAANGVQKPPEPTPVATPPTAEA